MDDLNEDLEISCDKIFADENGKQVGRTGNIRLVRSSEGDIQFSWTNDAGIVEDDFILIAGDASLSQSEERENSFKLSFETSGLQYSYKISDAAKLKVNEFCKKVNKLLKHSLGESIETNGRCTGQSASGESMIAQLASDEDTGDSAVSQADGLSTQAQEVGYLKQVFETYLRAEEQIDRLSAAALEAYGTDETVAQSESQGTASTSVLVNTSIIGERSQSAVVKPPRIIQFGKNEKPPSGEKPSSGQAQSPPPRGQSSPPPKHQISRQQSAFMAQFSKKGALDNTDEQPPPVEPTPPQDPEKPQEERETPKVTESKPSENVNNSDEAVKNIEQKTPRNWRKAFADFIDCVAETVASGFYRVVTALSGKTSTPPVPAQIPSTPPPAPSQQQHVSNQPIIEVKPFFLIAFVLFFKILYKKKE